MKISNFKFQILTVVFIFLCSASFRLTNLDLIEFKLDEARDVYEMEKLFAAPFLPERGTIQSTGVYNPPLWYYILAFVSIPSRDPQYLSGAIALINSIAVAGFYLVVRKFWGQWVGVGAALLLAFSPWSILFSRKIWAPDILLPFLVVWVWCLCVIARNSSVISSDSERSRDFSPPKAVRNDKLRKWAWFGLVLTLGLLAQIHVSGLFLGVGMGVMLGVVVVLRAKPEGSRNLFAHIRARFFAFAQNDIKYAIFGLLIALVPLTPYISYEIRNGCPDCRAFRQYRSGEYGIVEPVYDANVFLRPFQLINGSGFQVALGEEGYAQFTEQYPFVKFLEFVFLMEFLLLPLGLWHIFKYARRGRPFVPVLLIVPVLYFLTKTPGHLYYFLILGPVVAALGALGAMSLHLGGANPPAGGHPRGVLGAVIVLLVVLFNIIFEVSFYKYLSDRRVVPGDYGATYGVVKEEAQSVGMKVEEYVIRMYRSNF